MKLSELDKARFWIKVTQTEYCWEWQGSINRTGYGMFRIPGGSSLAHRISYEIINGPIPTGKQVCHSCDNPKCVNPSHLFTGTHLDNMRDKQKKGRGRHQGRTSKYHGVGFRNDSCRWRAYVSTNKIKKTIGSFKTEIEAAQARDTYVTKNKIDIELNFLPSPPQD